MLQIASFLSLLITAALVAFFARRILGAPIGWPRVIIIGVLMFASGRAARGIPSCSASCSA